MTDWTPKNATGEYSGERLTLKEALKNSVNSVSAYLMKQLGDTEPVRGLCNNMGIDSIRQSNGRYLIPPGSPSICLGAADLTVMHMTGAYSTFANNGVYREPFVIRKIEDRNGRLLYRSIPEEKAALPADANWVILDMLKYNVKGAPGINKLKSDAGGKTGTTNSYADAWFMGVTPRLVVGTWVGGEDRWIRFLSLADGQGSKLARPIFADFIARLENDPDSGYDYTARFTPPPGEMNIETNCDVYENQGAPGDEEDFSSDGAGGDTDDTSPPRPGKARRPDDTFGDQD
jgi:penicillin-binding protein 1A